MEMGPPPALVNGVATDPNPPATNDESSPLPGGFIPGVSHLYGPITRTDLSLGGTGGSISAPTFVTPAGEIATTNGLTTMSGDSAGPSLNGFGVNVAAAPTPESGSTFVLLTLSAVAILIARQSALAKIARR